MAVRCPLLRQLAAIVESSGIVSSCRILVRVLVGNSYVFSASSYLSINSSGIFIDLDNRIKGASRYSQVGSRILHGA